MKKNLEVVHDINKQFNENLQIDNVKSRPDEYYDTISKYGVTDKLNNIIDNFQNNLNNSSKSSSIFSKLDLNIGIICDEFLYYSLKDSANFKYVPYHKNLDVDRSFDVFLVVSSWRGLDNSWDYIANPKGQKRKELIQLIRKYNELEIPTIFYSKEDPISYDEYLSLAKECNYIFTSAKEMIDKYINDTGNINVEFLEFGINVSYHNPIGKNLEDDYLSQQVTFAGSWMKRFPLRNESALKLFEGVIKTEHDLSIIDRQYERKMERYHYPAHLLRNISATIPHSRLMDLHKATQWGINLNSVQDSMTMFANRIYELQGMGNIILSNYNQGVHNKFPNVKMVYLKEDIQETLNNMSFYEKKSLIAKGIREVMFNHTAFHRVTKMMRNINAKYEIYEPSILVIGEGENSRNSFDRQSYKNITYIDKNKFKNEKSVIEAYDFVAELNNQDIYEEYYLENLLSAFAYTDVEVVQMDKNEYNYSDKYNFRFSMFKTINYNDESPSVVFNIPKTEVIETAENELTESSSESMITIIIPIDNNNINKLEDKALYSLKKLKRFSELSIILVDKEEIYKQNHKTINRILRKYDNIDLINSYNDHGTEEVVENLFENIKTELISFLNPENELIIKNYNVLLNQMFKNKDLDIAYAKSINYLSTTSLHSNLEEIVNSKDFNSANFLETFIFRIGFINDNNIKFDVEEISKDSFLLSLIDNSDRYESIDKVIHKNNAYKNNFKDNENTIVSLRSSLENEKAKYSFITDGDLLSKYVNEIFPEIFIIEYMGQFKKLMHEDKAEGMNIIKNIIDLYITHYDYNNSDFNKVIELLFHYTN